MDKNHEKSVLSLTQFFSKALSVCKSIPIITPIIIPLFKKPDANSKLILVSVFILSLSCGAYSNKDFL